MTTPKKFVIPDYTERFIDVYLAELDYVKQRRDKMELPSEELAQEWEWVHQELDNPLTDTKKLMPRMEPGLVGLALSGGGIRSATFNLGLLQALAKRKVLQYCDYLSTVSGGGYIGSCLSSLLADTTEASTKPAEFPLREQLERGTERKEVNHLRATKNYLGLSTGLFDADNWHVIGLNISAKLLLDAIPIALIVLFTLFLYRIETATHDLFFWDRLNEWLSVVSGGDEGKLTKVGLKIIVTTLAILAVLWVIIIHCGQVWRFKPTTYEARQRYGSRMARWTMIAAALSVMVLLFDSIYTNAWHMMMDEYSDSFFDFESVIIFLIVASFAVILGGVLSFYKSQTQEKLFHIILSAALVLLSITLPVGLLAVVYKVEYELQTSHLTARTCELQQQLLPKNEKKDCIESLKPGVEKLFVEAEGFLVDMLDYLKEPTREIKLGEIEPILIKAIEETRENNRVRQDITTVMLIISAVLLLMGVFTNINYNSLHYFYRDRLSKTFLIRRSDKDKVIEPNHALLLKDLHQYYNGPYHLINATLNVPDSKNWFLQGRRADFFIFSKFYCGADSTGYQNTKDYDNGQTELATAMAISGAAASSAMGTSTNSLLAVTMTLLNYRLHQWLPNPNPQKVRRFTFWPAYLFKELLRRGTENDPRLNLSDGGHHENLGVYPLLKRRCRIIIASDAGADPHFKMADLANLQRKARIDLGIEIQLSKRKKLRLNPQRQTQRHFAIGKILYPEGTEGLLLYLKATVTGSESEDLLAYRRTNEGFPHQSTANQFFNEDQFESYRRLGQFIGEKVFAKDIENVKELEELLEQLFQEDETTRPYQHQT